VHRGERVISSEARELDQVQRFPPKRQSPNQCAILVAIPGKRKYLEGGIPPLKITCNEQFDEPHDQPRQQKVI
jgi:hypothetical protein